LPAFKRFIIIFPLSLKDGYRPGEASEGEEESAKHEASAGMRGRFLKVYAGEVSHHLDVVVVVVALLAGMRKSLSPPPRLAWRAGEGRGKGRGGGNG